MHVISRKKILVFAADLPDAAAPLDAWYRMARRARWAHFAEVRVDYPSADQVDSMTVFNVGGNKYRLIAVIKYRRARVYIRAILTHKDYDRGQWKADKPKPAPKNGKAKKRKGAE